jgi:hypothetical protein
MLQDRWTGRRAVLLRAAVMIMGVIAVLFLAYELWRLIGQQGESGAIDLKQFHAWVQRWFAGEATQSTYPPATFAILWPLLGWMPLPAARVLWAVSSLAALAWLSFLIVRESGANTRLEAWFVGLMPVSMYATGLTIGGGRLIVHQLPLLVAGLLLLLQGPARWRRDLLATVLISLALMKPSVAAPFFWLVLFIPGRIRPALLVACEYATLTLTAVAFQAAGLAPLLQDWAGRSVRVSAVASVELDNASLQSLLAAFGLQRWDALASLLVLAALGLWIYFHRRADLWLLLGVVALVARFWTYHAPYDDLLVLLPMVTLFRVAAQGLSESRRPTLAGVLLACTLLSTLAPGGRYLLPWPLNTVYITGQVCVWLAVLGFLHYQARPAAVIAPAAAPTVS